MKNFKMINFMNDNFDNLVTVVNEKNMLVFGSLSDCKSYIQVDYFESDKTYSLIYNLYDEYDCISNRIDYLNLMQLKNNILELKNSVFRLYDIY